MRYDKVYEILANRAIKQTQLDLDAFAQMMMESGIPDDKIAELFLNDLENNGPIFGKFFRSLGAAAGSSVDAAIRQGEAVGTAMELDPGFAEFVSVNDLEDAIDSADPEAMVEAENRIENIEHTWIAELVNTCERCLPLHGQTRTLSEWAATGLDPATIHPAEWGARCRCRLVPKSQAESKDELLAPLARIRTKVDGTNKLSKKTMRAVSQRDIEKAIDAARTASESIEGRRTLRALGKANE